MASGVSSSVVSRLVVGIGFVVDVADVDGDGGRRRLERAVVGDVGEGVDAGEVGAGLVGEGPIGGQGDDAVGGTRDELGGEGLGDLGIAVVVTVEDARRPRSRGSASSVAL